MNQFAPQQIEEGWVKFTRYPCAKGYLDRWYGDCNSDPNNESKSLLNLNSFTSYWRCNGGKWINDRELGREREILSILDLREVFTAEEIWEELTNPK